MSRLFEVEHRPDTNDWHTPPWVFDGMGVEFDLDVCAPPGGVDWIPARKSLSESDDGLLTPWSGWVWCNPPYSAPAQWCRKWAKHAPGGCLLIRSDLSTAGPNIAFGAAHAIYFAPKRINFVNGHGAGTGAVAFSTVLLARGDRCVAGLHRLAQTLGGHARSLTDRRDTDPHHDCAHTPKETA